MIKCMYNKITNILSVYNKVIYMEIAEHGRWVNNTPADALAVFADKASAGMRWTQHPVILQFLHFKRIGIIIDYIHTQPHIYWKSFLTYIIYT